MVAGGRNSSAADGLPPSWKLSWSRGFGNHGFSGGLGSRTSSKLIVVVINALLGDGGVAAKVINAPLVRGHVSPVTAHAAFS
jgi:hypothetical protein